MHAIVLSDGAAFINCGNE